MIHYGRLSYRHFTRVCLPWPGFDTLWTRVPPALSCVVIWETRKLAMIALLALIAVLPLASCADPTHWAKPGAGQAEYYKDEYTCQRQTLPLVSVPPAPISNDPFTAGQRYAQNNDRELEIRNLMDSCMRAHGWTLYQ